MTQDDMERDLQDARAYLSCTRLTADRCRHESVTTTSLWIFDGKRQIGAVSRTEDVGADRVDMGTGYRWRASHMHNGMGTSERHYPTMVAGIVHVMERDKALAA